MTTYELYISGKVQGVFFRGSTQAKAQALGVMGFVENLPDGRVHAIIQGNRADCQKLIQWSYSGPASARVDLVEIEPISSTTSFPTFTIRR